MLATAGLLGGLSQPAAAGFRPRLTPPALTGGFGFGLANGPGEIGWMTSSGLPRGYRYQYLAGGVNTGTGWETWNSPPGQFAGYYMTNSAANGYLPVFSYYELLQSMPSSGTNESDRDFNNLNNAATMNAYYANFVLLMHQAASYSGQVIVQVEPDLWGYLEQRAAGGSAASVPAKVKSSGYAGVASPPIPMPPSTRPRKLTRSPPFSIRPASRRIPGEAPSTWSSTTSPITMPAGGSSSTTTAARTGGTAPTRSCPTSTSGWRG